MNAPLYRIGSREGQLLISASLSGIGPRAYSLGVLTSAPAAHTNFRMRRAPTLVLATTLVAAFASSAGAQGRWKEVGKTRTGNPVFIDQRTVKTGKDGIISATIRVAYDKPVKTPKGNVTASRALAMFDCKASTFATKENAMYIDEKTDKVFQRTVNAKPGFGPTIAGNFADVAMKHLCAK